MRTEKLIDREVDYVLAALSPSNALVCQVCLHTGLRVSDVLSLRTEQLAPRFWVTESKTKKRKQVGLPAPLLEAVKAQAGEVWAFPGARDPSKHRTRQAVWKDVKRAAVLFRLPQNVGVHSFRKTYAQDCMDVYGDIEKVRKMLNHSSAICTMIYLMGLRNFRDKELSKMGFGAARYGRRL
jgi:integrase